MLLFVTCRSTYYKLEAVRVLAVGGSRRDDSDARPVCLCTHTCCCLLLQDLVQNCSRGGGGGGTREEPGTLTQGAPIFPRVVCICCRRGLLLQDLLQSCSRWGRGRVEDMCYSIRRAEAGVDESDHHALVNAGERHLV
jgi:hypothetical protein